MENTPQSTFTTILKQHENLSPKEFAKWFDENWLYLNDQENQYMEQFFTEQELLFGLHEVFQDGRLEKDLEETESVQMTFSTLKYGQTIRIYGKQE